LAHETAGIDILVNNAGDIPGRSLEKIDEATWRHAWELKVFGSINLTRLVRNAALWPSPSHLAGRACIMVFVAARSCDRCLRRVLAVWKCPTEWA
jgi:NAD(P)-dependent dehydrogenase (short-subunit alcohol dehydrogenase family)